MTLHHGDCLDVMAGMDPESVDAVVTDPPYDLTATGARNGSARSNAGTGPYARLDRGGFMGKVWDGTGIAFRRETWEAAYRVAKPSAYLLAFGGTRTVHRMTVALEDAGWIIRDMLVWGYACLSDDTEILTREGWVRYNSASVGQWIAAFDPSNGELRWEQAQGVHVYDHEGPMAVVGPQLVTLNHRVIRDPDDGTVPCLSGMWDDVHEASRLVAEGSIARVLEAVQREAAHSGSSIPSRSRVVGGAATATLEGDDWPSQPRLEGRRYRVQEAWELFRRPLRAGTGVGASDGEAGRLRDGAPTDDRGGVRLPADADGMREPREPRSDRQSPGEPDALAGQPDPQAVRVGQVPDRDGESDALRLVNYRGKVWCITVPSGAFVARRNGVVFVTGNSGFPKSKASLKPAWEPIVMARKPGPLRMLAIDECRIGTEEVTSLKGLGSNVNLNDDNWKSIGQRPDPTTAYGRWPANIVLTATEDGRAIFDGGIEGVVGGGETARSAPASGPTWEGPSGSPSRSPFLGMGDREPQFYGDTGTYSRFFLVPKADRADREPVLGGLPTKRRTMGSGLTGVSGDRSGRGGKTEPLEMGVAERANHHPTVKPTELMRHLVRLVTPAGGTVLDPFLGSGTTAIAAEMEGFSWIGIEKEAEYVAIAEARLNGVQKGLGLSA